MKGSNYKVDYKKERFKNLSLLINEISTSSFIDESNNINIKIIERIESAADDLNGNGRKGIVTRTSVRNIYNAFKDLERQFEQKFIFDLNDNNTKSNVNIEESKEQSFKSILPFIKMMNGKIKYLVNRKKENEKAGFVKEAYDKFYEFNNVSINKISNYREFEAFLKIFECLYGFLKKGSEN